MAGLTNYSESASMNRALRGTAFTPPSQIYFSCHTSIPTEAGTGSEITTGGFTRQALSFGAYVSRRIASSTAFSMTATADIGQVAGFGLHDAATGGNMLAFGGNTPVPNITNGGVFSRAAGEVVISLLATQSLSGICPFLAQYILELMFLNTAKSALPSLTANLYSTPPDNEGAGGTELAASGYSAKTATYADFSSAGLSNFGADIVFTTAAPAAWGDVPCVVFKSGSNLLARAPILPLPTIGINAPFTLPAANNGIGID